MEEYSNFPEEKEVLLQAGIKFRVVDIIDETFTVTEHGKPPRTVAGSVVYLQNFCDKYSNMNCFKRAYKYLVD